MSHGQRGFFDDTECLARLTELGDPLIKLNQVVDWEMFRPTLESAVRRSKSSKGGRPPFDVVLMFKILVLQRLNNLSDDRMEYLITDRFSYRRFLNLELSDKVPDAKTIWKFRNDLSYAGAARDLFTVFNQLLKSEGLITHKGSIIDSTFEEVPRQHNSREENAQIKEGKIPEDWQTAEQKHRLPQKDTDARWTQKGDSRYFGYKNHIKGDEESKLIVDYRVTDAAVHDSQCCLELLDEADQILYADSAYFGAPIAEGLPPGCENKICDRGKRNAPLTEGQREANRLISQVRARIEHIFGFIVNSMGGKALRCIGIVRVRFMTGLTNLVYNMCRYRYLKGVF
ncbi:MAG: IS5 family transposase [Thermoguttaceae bacterium]|nr:IS5 family transposase [Thermoguttaceae bacterium]